MWRKCLLTVAPDVTSGADVSAALKPAIARLSIAVSGGLVVWSSQREMVPSYASYVRGGAPQRKSGWKSRV